MNNKRRLYLIERSTHLRVSGEAPFMTDSGAEWSKRERRWVFEDKPRWNFSSAGYVVEYDHPLAVFLRGTDRPPSKCPVEGRPRVVEAPANMFPHDIGERK